MGGGVGGHARTYKGDRGSGLLQGTVGALLVLVNVGCCPCQI